MMKLIILLFFFVWNGLLLDLLPADDLLPPVQNAVQRDEV